MKISSDALLLHLQDDCASYMRLNADAPEVSWTGFAAHRLTSSVFKKLETEKDTNADDKALQVFLHSNQLCAEWREPQPQNSKDELLLGEFQHALYDFWFKNGDHLVSHADEVLSVGRSGPGSSLDTEGNDFYTKHFSSPMSMTSPILYRMYKDHFCGRLRFHKAEKARLEQYGTPRVVEGSTINFAFKRTDISRTINTEPPLNMFYQLGFGSILEDRLKEVFGISLTHQPDLNRELARCGSVTGNFATIDLTDASGRIAMGLMDTYAPRAFTDWCRLFRSPTMQLPDKSRVQLHMVGTMGNGFTFPLQTILFACVISACYRTADIKLERGRSYTTNRWDTFERKFKKQHKPGNFGVFGDDIIVRTEVAHDVCRLLELLGLEVNTEKSFVEGPFRESCGGDYYKGHYVRQVSIKKLKTSHDIHVAINRLNEWSSMTGILLNNSVRYLLKCTSKVYVPMAESEDAGIRIPFDLVPKDQVHHQRADKMFAASKKDRKIFLKLTANTDSIRYERYVSRPNSFVIGEGGFTKVPKGSKERIVNLDGLLLTFLRGDILSHKMAVRLTADTTMYDKKWGSTPFWDWVPSPYVSNTLATRVIPLIDATWYNFLEY